MSEKWLDISDADYHASPRIGHTTLREFAASPIRVRERMGKRVTSNMVRGDLADRMIRGEIDEARLHVSKYKTRCASLQAEQDEIGDEYEVVTAAELEGARLLVGAVKSNPDTAAMLRAWTRIQPTLHWKDLGSQLECKARPDGIDENGLVMCDVKTSQSYPTFVRETLLPSYVAGVPTPGHVVSQAGHYTAGTLRRWRFCVIVSVLEPYPEAGLVWLDEETIAWAGNWCRARLVELAECLADERPWQSEWSRRPQIYHHEGGLVFADDQITKGGKPLKGLF